MTDFKLNVQKREEKVNKTRSAGMIPGIVYGHGTENTSVAFDKIEFSKLYRDAGTSNLVELHVDDKKYKTLIQDIQFHPVNHEVVHVDFFKVNMKEKINAEIPLNFIGDSPAVMNLEGSLITPVDTIEVECLPGDLISEIDVDISVLDDFEKDIRIADLKVPAGIEVQNEAEEVVAFVQEPRSEEELESLNEEVVENVEGVEVENKGEEAPTEGNEEKKSE